jgi:hypothetical protein
VISAWDIITSAATSMPVAQLEYERRARHLTHPLQGVEAVELTADDGREPAGRERRRAQPGPSANDATPPPGESERRN